MSLPNNSAYAAFIKERDNRIRSNPKNKEFADLTRNWIIESFKQKYMYNFEALGRPVIQFPQDLIAIQEIIWSVRPDVIVETGIAHGGSTIWSAALLGLLDLIDMESKPELAPLLKKRRVVGVDIEIREHNRVAIEEHDLSNRIALIEGSSTDLSTIKQVQDHINSDDTVLVILDSNHTHEHVLAELTLYSPLVTFGSYCVVLDTVIQNLPQGSFPDRSWEVGNNSMTAALSFVEKHDDFLVDAAIHEKLMITSAPHGFLKKIK